MRGIVAAVACLFAVAAAAQSYPARPMRIVIPFSPGGTTDTPGRILAQGLSEALGQQFFVDNRPGAGAEIEPQGQSNPAFFSAVDPCARAARREPQISLS